MSPQTKEYPEQDTFSDEHQTKANSHQEKDSENVVISGLNNLTIEEHEAQRVSHSSQAENEEQTDGCETPFVHEFKTKEQPGFNNNKEDDQIEKIDDNDEEDKRADCTFAELPEKIGFLYKKSSMFFVGWQKQVS